MSKKIWRVSGWTGLRGFFKWRLYMGMIFLCLPGIWTPSIAMSLTLPLHDIREAAQKGNIVKRVAIFGRDDRRPIPKKYAGLKNKVGLLYNDQSQTLCTAFCAAPNIIVTAAHCFFGNHTGKRPKIYNFSFRIENKRSSTITHIAGSRKKIARQFVVAGTTGLRTRPPMDAPKDWALARLATPACRFGSLRIAPQSQSGLVRASKRKKIFQVAYHWDYKHWQLAYSGPCRIKSYTKPLDWPEVRRLFAEPAKLVLHTCDTGGASSGSPIFFDTPTGPVVVGINVGSYEQSKVFVRDGRIVRRSQAKVIANTGVNAKAFHGLMGSFRRAFILESSEALKVLQAALKKQGLYGGQLDGTFGPLTRDAIRTYQNLNQLPVTGLPTKHLLTSLVDPNLPWHIKQSIEKKASETTQFERPTIHSENLDSWENAPLPTKKKQPETPIFKLPGTSLKEPHFSDPAYDH